MRAIGNAPERPQFGTTAHQHQADPVVRIAETRRNDAHRGSRCFSAFADVPSRKRVDPVGRIMRPIASECVASAPLAQTGHEKLLFQWNSSVGLNFSKAHKGFNAAYAADRRYIPQI
jgi:hypothetical protein